MRVLVSGHNGYIGSVLVPMFADAGHEVTGLDTYFYEECTYGPEPAAPPRSGGTSATSSALIWRASTR